jgi:hypothetical protein
MKKYTAEGTKPKVKTNKKCTFKVLNAYNSQSDFQANCLSLRLSAAHPGLLSLQPLQFLEVAFLHVLHE